MGEACSYVGNRQGIFVGARFLTSTVVGMGELSLLDRMVNQDQVVDCSVLFNVGKATRYLITSRN